MSHFFIIYMLCWGLACLISGYLMLRHKSELVLFRKEYRNLLGRRWKLVSFLVAATGMTVMAPYTGDPTWDYADAAFMSLLTFATAPWAVGELYRAIRGPRQFAYIYIALCVWMFSASWSYDLYIVLRDGFYPGTWLANIGASSVLYLSAGLLWSLEWKAGHGVIFAFMEPDWPAASEDRGFGKVQWVAWLFMLMVASLMIGFFLIKPDA